MEVCAEPAGGTSCFLLDMDPGNSQGCWGGARSERMRWKRAWGKAGEGPVVQESRAAGTVRWSENEEAAGAGDAGGEWRRRCRKGPFAAGRLGWLYPHISVGDTAPGTGRRSIRRQPPGGGTRGRKPAQLRARGPAWLWRVSGDHSLTPAGQGLWAGLGTGAAAWDPKL